MSRITEDLHEIRNDCIVFEYFTSSV